MVVTCSTEISIVDARAELAEVSSRVAYRGERVIVTKHGKPFMAMISVDDLQKLEKYEVVESLQQGSKRQRISLEEAQELSGE